MSRRQVYRVLWIVLLLVLVTACAPDNPPLPTLVPTEAPSATPLPSNTPEDTATPTLTLTPTPQPILGSAVTDPQRIGYLRVLHAAPDTAPVDIYVNDVAFGAGIEYGLATGRTNILAGDYNLRVAPRGIKPDEQTLALTPIQIAVGKSLIVVFSGVPNALNVSIVEELTEPLESGKSRVNFVHAVPLAPLTKGQVNAQDRSEFFDFGQQSGGVEVDSGDSVVTFASSEQTLATYTTNLFERTNYTFVMIGRSSDLEHLTVLAFNNPVAGRLTARVINMARDVGAIDFYVDSVRFAENVAYGTASPRDTQTDGTRAVSIFASGANPSTDTPLLADFPVILTSDKITALIVMGSRDSLTVATFNEDISPIRPDMARLAFINALESVPFARAGTEANLRDDIGTLAYGQGSPYIDLFLGQNRLFWADSEGREIETYDNLQIESGLTYLYLLTGDTDNRVLLSEPVEVREDLIPLPQEDGTTLLPTEIPQTRIRIINAVDDEEPLDFWVEDQVLAAALQPRTSTPYIQVPYTVFPIRIFHPRIGVDVDNSELRLLTTGDYSVFLYGTSLNPNIIAFSDLYVPKENVNPTIRLINLSLSESIVVGLLQSVPTDPFTPASDIRPSIQIGAEYRIGATNPRTASASIAFLPGVHDLIVSDGRTNVEAVRFRSVTLSPQQHYDLVVTYIRDTDEIRAWLLAYR